MRGYLLCLIVGLTAGGCAGKNTVAGTEKTEAEQLESSIPGWCASTCQRISRCGGDVEVDPSCPSQCQREMGRYTNGVARCVELGEKFKDCVDGLTCKDFDENAECVLSEANEQLCPENDSSIDVGGSDPTGPVSGPVIGSGGTVSSGGAPTVGGGAPTSGPVRCNGNYGTGGGASGESPSSAVTCEEGFMGCDDGHEYSWVCARGSEGQVGCTCFVDSEVTGGFDPGASDCPTHAVVNLGCHWNLLQ